jgi:hypothetical protein
MWVIEGVPKDRYYLYGKIELWIDDYTYAGAWNRRFSWKGDLLNTYQITLPATEPFNDTERFWASTFAYQCAENIKANRATRTAACPSSRRCSTTRPWPEPGSEPDQCAAVRCPVAPREAEGTRPWVRSLLTPTPTAAGHQRRTSPRGRGSRRSAWLTMPGGAPPTAGMALDGGHGRHDVTPHHILPAQNSRIAARGRRPSRR